MLKKAIITIKGDVQEAGYRAYIRKTAQKLNLGGYVENLPDGNVNIMCEGEEEKIKKFCKEIKIKTLTIDVENIEVKYEKASGKFKNKGFKVKVSDIGEEMFQGYATATKYFMIGFEKQDKMLEKQDKTLDAITSMHKDLGDKFDSVKVEIIDRYGEFGKDIKEIKSDIKEEMSGIRGEIKEMKNLFADYLHYLIKKERDEKNAKSI